MKQKHRSWGYFVFGIIIVAFLIASYFIPGLKNFSSPEFVRDFLLNLGQWGYLVFVGLLLLSVPVPMPSTPIALGGGYVYGIVLGTILALVATMIGATVSFFLIRTYGRPLLEKLVDEHHIKHFNHVFKKKKSIAALISYAVPIFPSDCVSLILGLTKMKYSTFILLVFIGHIPRFLIINSLGEDLYLGFTLKTALILLGATIFILIAVFRENIKKFAFKELHELENKVSVKSKA